MANKKKTSLELIDDQIITLQKATKSEFSFLTRLHDWLCQNFRIYYFWHRHPITESLHWMIFSLIILFALMFMLLDSYYFFRSMF